MEIRPFKAYRYNEAVVGDAGSCISPPYDVINPEQADELYKKSQYNIVRIIKGKTQPGDSENNNQYTRAAAYLNDWIRKGVLKQDLSENIYAYVQNFELTGREFERLTFIALGKLEEFGKIVRPHEQTLSKPKIDRLNLQRATGATFGLVFMLYEDKEKIADKIIRKAEDQKPAIDFVDEYQVRHRLFLISDKNDIKQIEKMMKGKSCIIADGHHRYETGLNYYKETGKPAAAYQAMAFTNTRNEGLIIFATHRVVSNLKDFDIKNLVNKLKENFDITEYKFDSKPDKAKAKQKIFSQMKAEYEKDRNAFGIYSGKGAFYTAVLKNEKVMDKTVGNMSSAWRSLDVAVLHKLILEGLLGIHEKKLAGESNIEYVKDISTAVDDSIAKADAGENQVVFFMNPPKIEQIQKVTDAGEKMPQKSTYFYPKMYTGLTVNKL